MVGDDAVQPIASVDQPPAEVTSTMPGTRRSDATSLAESVAVRIEELRATLDAGAPLDVLVPEIRDVEERLLGQRVAMLRQLDARTTAQLVGRPALVRLWTELLRLEGAAYVRAGAGRDARAIAQRAAALDEEVALAADAALHGVKHSPHGAGYFTGSSSRLSLGDFRTLGRYALLLLGLASLFVSGRGRYGLIACAVILLTAAMDAIETRRSGARQEQTG